MNRSLRVIATSLLALLAVDAAPWYQLTGSNIPRMEVIECHFTDAVYIMGGYYTTNRDVSNAVEKYTISSNSWSTQNVTLPLSIHHADAATYTNGKCYIVGGYTGSMATQVPRSELYSFDGTTFLTLTAMPTARGALAADIYGDSLYVVGGAQVYNQEPTYPTLEVYNITSNTWTTKASMTYKREHLTARFIGSKLYAAAGRVPGDRKLTYMESYDVATNAWTTLANVPTGRSGLHAAVVGGKMFTFGGEGSGNEAIFSNVEAYNPATSSWECYYPMPYPRHGTGILSVGSNIYVFLGGPEPATSLSNTAMLFNVSEAVAASCPWSSASTGSATSTGTSTTSTGSNSGVGHRAAGAGVAIIVSSFIGVLINVF